MSNALKRKRKRMEPVGFERKTIVRIADAMTRQRNTENLIEESYLNIKLIAYQVLHDYFGFGKKRIDRVENTIDQYLQKAANGLMTETQMMHLLKEKYDIDVKAEANKVPFKERFYLTKAYILPESKQSAGMYLLESICNYFALLGTCLKTQFKFSKNRIEKAFYHIRDYINTLSRPKQFELTMPMIAESVKIECGFIDKRFIGENNGK